MSSSSLDPRKVGALLAVSSNTSSTACRIAANRRSKQAATSPTRISSMKNGKFKIRTPKVRVRSLRGKLRREEACVAEEQEMSAAHATADKSDSSSPSSEATHISASASPDSGMSSPVASADCSPVHVVPSGARNVRVCMAPTAADTQVSAAANHSKAPSKLQRTASMDHIISTIPTPKAVKGSKRDFRVNSKPRGRAAANSARGAAARASSLVRQRSNPSLSSSNLTTPSKDASQKSRIAAARSRSASRLAHRRGASEGGARTPGTKPPRHIAMAPLQVTDDTDDASAFRSDLGCPPVPDDISGAVAAARLAAASAAASAGTPRAGSTPRARGCSTPAFDSMSLCDEDRVAAEDAVRRMGAMPQAKLMQALMMLKLQMAKQEHTIAERDADIAHLRAAAHAAAAAPPLPPSTSRTATPSKRRPGGFCHTPKRDTEQTFTKEEHESALAGVRSALEAQAAAAQQQVAALTGELLQLKQQVADAESKRSDESLAATAKQDSLQAHAEHLEGQAEQLRGELRLEKQRVAQAQTSANTLQAELKSEQKVRAACEAECAALQESLEAEQSRVCSLRDELAAAQAAAAAAQAQAEHVQEQFEEVDTARRALQEEVLDLKGAVRVMVRVRPRLGAEQGRVSVGGGGRRRRGAAAAKPTKQQQLFEFPNATDEGVGPSGTAELKFVPPSGSVGSTDSGASSAKRAKAAGTADFNFNAVFPPTAGNGTVFNQVQQIVASVLDGKRGCVFAYGQTGSGKTHTMLAKGVQGGAHDTEAGMIPQAVAQVFHRAGVLGEKGWSVRIQAEMLEIYNETVRDLLAGEAEQGTLDIKLNKNTGQPHVPGLTVVPVSTWEDVTGVLARAEEARATSATQSNEVSSRSHCVFTLRVFCEHGASGQSRSGVLNLVDLAGSERVGRSGASGERLKETRAINKSLSALGMVLSGLAAKARHVPYRDSKLTYLLQPYLADTTQCRTLMIATVSPCAGDAHETQCTLRFAQGVAAITAKKAPSTTAAAGGGSA